MFKKLFSLLLITTLMVSPVHGAGLDSDTKLYLPFDENTLGAATKDGALEVLDSGATGHIVTQNATAQLSTANVKFGTSSLLLDGNSDYLSIPDSADWDIVGSAVDTWTIHCWIKMLDNTPAATSSIVSHQESGSQTYWGTWIGTDGKPDFYVRDGGTYIIQCVGTAVVPDTGWNHFAMVKIADEYALYINGIQCGYVQDSSTKTFTGPLLIGTLTTTWFGGNIAHLEINEGNPLSATINADGTSGSYVTPTEAPTADANTKLLLQMDTQDLSGTGGSDAYHIPTFVGTAQLDTGQKLSADDYSSDTSSWLGDGNSDYVTLPDSADWDLFANNTDSQTIDCWFRTTVTATTQCIVGQTESASPAKWWSLLVGSGNVIYFYGYIDNGTPWLTGTTLTGGSISINTWYHIAICKVAGVAGAYLDGVQIDYDTIANTGTLAGILGIGRQNANDTFYFNGNIAHLRIQDSNIFSASPNVGVTDTITASAGPYTASAGGVTMPLLTMISIMNIKPIFDIWDMQQAWYRWSRNSEVRKVYNLPWMRKAIFKNTWRKNV